MAEEERRDNEGKVEKGYLDTMIEALSYLVKDKMYGPLDVLATTPDPQLAYGVLYNAIRYLASQGYPTPTEDDINKLLVRARKQPEILREIAIKALVRGVEKRRSTSLQAQAAFTKQETKKEGI